jgi:uncharacterized protein DUF4123/FHA domain-containing protein
MEPQRVIVAVKWGPLDGRRAVLSPGDVVRVGRGERAGLVVPHDRQMSALHVELSWDGARCRFRDLKSATGTLRNGEPGLAEGELANGDWLRAGETVLTVHIEASTPSRDVDDDPREEPGARAQRLARQATAEVALRAIEEEAARAPLYAVLDAARDRRILELCRESVEEHRSLYDGVEGETMAHVAPYLVRLPAGSRLLTSLVREGWGRRWGVYLTCALPFGEVRRQLRRFLMVEMEESHERMYFRFYDPRTLATFVPSCSPRQAQEFFGGAEAFFLEGEGGALTRFTRPDLQTTSDA